MTVTELHAALYREVSARAYIRRLDMFDLTASLLKARLMITSQLFVQIYRNDRFDTTNFPLIYNGRRIFGRDQLGGQWHRHPVEAPYRHDGSEEGRRPARLGGFLNEIESILARKNLP